MHSELTWEVRVYVFSLLSAVRCKTLLIYVDQTLMQRPTSIQRRSTQTLRPIDLDEPLSKKKRKIKKLESFRKLTRWVICHRIINYLFRVPTKSCVQPRTRRDQKSLLRVLLLLHRANWKRCHGMDGDGKCFSFRFTRSVDTFYIFGKIERRGISVRNLIVP